jgi:hypothetical protein
VIGSAVNLVLPGVGSLAAAGIGSLKSDALQQQVAAELSAAVGEVAAKRDLPKLAFLQRRRARSDRRKVQRLLVDHAGFGDLMGLPRPVVESPGQELEHTFGPDEEESALEAGWLGLARAQISLAASPGRVPGTWQDEFAALLQVTATDGLRNADAGRWRMVFPRESDDTPTAAEVAEWSKLLTRVFAARLSANKNLEPFVQELKDQDRLALQHALLLRLDQQRTSLQLIAGVLIAAASVAGTLLGLDAAGLDLGI